MKQRLGLAQPSSNRPKVLFWMSPSRLGSHRSPEGNPGAHPFHRQKLMVVLYPHPGRCGTDRDQVYPGQRKTFGPRNDARTEETVFDSVFTLQVAEEPSPSLERLKEAQWVLEASLESGKLRLRVQDPRRPSTDCLGSSVSWALLQWTPNAGDNPEDIFVRLVRENGQ